MSQKLAKYNQFWENPPNRAAGGKIILTLAAHTILYHLQKFHGIILRIDKTAVIWNSTTLFSP